MIKRESTPGWHPSLSRLARLTEPGSAESAEEAVVTHLATCRRCFGTYCELARQRVAWLGGETTSTSEYDRLALSLVSRPARRRRRWRPLVWVPAAGLAVLLAVWFGAWPHREPPSPGQPSRLVLMEAIENASAMSLVYPGGEAGAVGTGELYRSGTRDHSIQATLDALWDELDGHDPDESMSFWLAAGYLADDQITNAETFLRVFRDRFPESDRLAILDAIRAYRTDSVDDSIRILQGVLGRSSRNAVARFNLGYVLAEEGDSRGLQLLTEVREQVPGTALGERAATEHARFSRRALE